MLNLIFHKFIFMPMRSDLNKVHLKICDSATLENFKKHIMNFIRPGGSGGIFKLHNAI